MNLDMEGAPLSRTPKRLAKQSAEAIALRVVHNSQQAIISYLFEDGKPNKLSLLIYLKKIKCIYWSDILSMVEPCRRLVSDSFTDVMELLSRQKEMLPNTLRNILLTTLETRAPYLLVMFAIQIIFTYGAGYSSAMDMLNLISVRSRTARIFNTLLEATKPFCVEKLSTAFLKFEDPLPILTVITYSPQLKHINLVNNSSMSVFNCLRLHSKNIEIFDIKLFSYYAVLTRDGSLSDFLFETFFEGQGMEAVMQSIDAEDEPLKSFPKLKEVMINSNSVNTRVPVNEFVYCLQHSYPKIKTKWFKFINVYKPSSKFLMSHFQQEPQFLGRKKHNWDVVEVGYVNDMEIVDDIIKPIEDCPTINHTVVEIDTALTSEVQQFIAGVMNRHNCDSIELVLYKHSLNVSPKLISSVFNNIGNTLQVLRLTLPHGLIGNEIIMALNACSSVQVLSLESNILEYQESNITPFKEFSNLTSLTVDIHSKLDRVKFLAQSLIIHLIEAAPCVRTLKLSNLSENTLEMMTKAGFLSKIVNFQIGSPFPKNLRWCVNQLPSLSVLTLNYEYWHYDPAKDGFYYALKKDLFSTSLSIFGIGKIARYPLKQSYEVFP